MLILARLYATQSRYIDKTETGFNEALYGSSLVTFSNKKHGILYAPFVSNWLTGRPPGQKKCREGQRWPLGEVRLFWTLDPLSDAPNKAIQSLYYLPRHQQIYPYFVWWYLKETRWRIIHLITSSAWVARKWNFGSLKMLSFKMLVWKLKSWRSHVSVQ